MNNFVRIRGNINEFNGLRMGLVCLNFVQSTESVKQESYPQGQGTQIVRIRQTSDEVVKRHPIRQ